MLVDKESQNKLLCRFSRISPRQATGFKQDKHWTFKNLGLIPVQCAMQEHCNVCLFFKEHTYRRIAPPVDTHEKSIPERTRRAMKNPRPLTEGSRRGESRSALAVFV